jgi:hypothetical protein
MTTNNDFKVGDLVLLTRHDINDSQAFGHGYGIVKQVCTFKHESQNALQVQWFGNGPGMLPLKTPGTSFWTRFHRHATDEACRDFEKQKKAWLETQKQQKS